MNKKTDIDRAVDYIAANPGCRTPDIEQAIGVANLAQRLKTLADAGFLLGCLIERPGKRPCYEFRLAATVTPGMTWAEFRGAEGPKKRSGHVVTARPMRATNPAAVVSKATQPLEGAKAKHIEPPRQIEPPAGFGAVQRLIEAAADVPQARPMLPHLDPLHIKPKILGADRPLDISIDNKSCLHISVGDDYIELAPAAARALGAFLKATEAVWQTA